MQLFKHLLTFFLFCVLTTHAQANSSLSVHIENILPSIVKIKAQKGEPSGDENGIVSVDSGGTGIVYAPGIVMTNAHVIGDARRIVVADQNGAEYRAVLIGKDTKTDIAVLEVAGMDLPTLQSPLQQVLKTGDGVFVIGFPFSLGTSVSVGVVGGLNRYLPNYPYLHFIQTDAAVNPGNSGGPMFDIEGKLVGVVSTYFARQGGYTNIAFAIPIDDASRIANALIRDKSIMRGSLGAELLLSEKVVRKMGEQNGIFVTAVDPDSPAAKGGLMAGDLIVGISGRKLIDSGELHRKLEHSLPDDILDLTVLRNGELITSQIRLEKAKEEKKSTTNIGKNDAAEKLGLVLNENDNGLEVALSYGVAQTAGFRSGDKIISIGGKKVRNIQEANERLTALKENEIVFIIVERNNVPFLLPLGSKGAIKGYSTKN